MDFLTLLPYLGIIILTVLNAILVLKRTIKVDDNKSEEIN